MKTLLFFSVIFLFSFNYCFALDIDDGIDIDDSISSYHEMGKIKHNIKYIMLNSYSKAHTMMNSDEFNFNNDNFVTNNSAIINGVVIGPGSKIQGDIIVIDQSPGDKVAVSTK